MPRMPCLAESRVWCFLGLVRAAIANPDSDWDIAVFINGDVSSWDTLRLADAAYDLIIDSGQFIQPVALPDGEAMKSDPLLERIKAEGREL